MTRLRTSGASAGEARDTYDLFEPPERGRFGDNESAARAHRVYGGAELIDLDLALHAETYPGKAERGAVKVSDTGEEKRAVWIPKSLCQIERQARSVAGTTTNGRKIQLVLVRLTTEQWVARDKGLA